MKTIAIIGFGRFGKVLARLLSPEFKVLVHDIENLSKEAQSLGAEFVDLEKALSPDTIFYAVPISKFEATLKSHLPILKNKDKKLLVDVLSVKMHPKKVFEKLLPKNCQAMLTHPMFGPDSIGKSDSNKLPIVIDQFTASKQEYDFWKKFFESKNLKVINMSASQHDKLAANSQGITHFVGRMLQHMNMKKTSIDTLGAKKLHEIIEQTCNDSWELFRDLQTKNPYTKQMRVKIEKSVERISSKLLPKRINPNKLIVGIQGGPGSFSQQAAKHILQKKGIKYEIKNLYTTDKVLNALHIGDIDRGVFAVHNSVGGVVHESVNAMAKFKFKIIEEFSIIIAHSLIIRPDAKLEDIDTIMTHPQVIKQCKNTLKKKYPTIKLTSGKAQLIDHSKVASMLKQKKLGKNIATMGSSDLAKLNNLKIVEENLQDQNQNHTSFFWVKRT